MVDPPHVFTTVFPFDDNEEAIITRCIRVFRCDPARIERSRCMVVREKDAQPPITLTNGDSNLLVFVSPTIRDDPQLGTSQSHI